MKTKDRELTIFTPGLDSRSLKMDYFDIDNMVIVGVTGSGKTTALNAIVKSMMESNDSKYLQLVMFDGFNNVCESPFFNSRRITPHTELQSIFLNQNMFYHELYNLLHTLLMVANSVVYSVGEEYHGLTEYPKLVPGVIVVVINEFEALPEYLRYLVRLIIRRKSPQVKFILTGQSERPFKDFISDIRYRITTRVDDEASNTLLRCNIGSRCADKYGTCWFYDSEEPDYYSKHVVNFTPESLLNRMMKTYSSGKESNSLILAKYYSVRLEKKDYEMTNQFMEEIYKVDIKTLLDDFLKIANKEV